MKPPGRWLVYLRLIYTETLWIYTTHSAGLSIAYCGCCNVNRVRKTKFHKEFTKDYLGWRTWPPCESGRCTQQRITVWPFVLLIRRSLNIICRWTNGSDDKVHLTLRAMAVVPQNTLINLIYGQTRSSKYLSIQNATEMWKHSLKRVSCSTIGVSTLPRREKEIEKRVFFWGGFDQKINEQSTNTEVMLSIV